MDDDSRFRERLAGFLQKEGHHVVQAGTAEEGIDLCARSAVDVVVLDLVLPGMGGLGALEQMKALPSVPMVIVTTAHGSIDTAVEAMRLGASDYVTKPVDLDALTAKLDEAAQLVGMRSDLDDLLAREQGQGLGRMVGDCDAMRAVYQKVHDVAMTDNTTVLVTGPSGTGKELVSRSIHTLSARKQKPFMQIDCTAIPLHLLESELFGYERGAFTGADRAKKGLLEVADRGTLFLDEIGDMPLELQGKFLRVLEERRARRVGGTREIRFDVRVIAATNQNLDRMVEEKLFRGDLLYRLKVFQIALPPLKERGNDILTLAQRFLREFAKSFRKPARGLDPEASRLLRAYGFPGNVRELRNIMEQAVILAQGPLITPDLLSVRVDEAQSTATHGASTERLLLEALGERPLEAAERTLIVQALERSAGNKKQAAALLGISRFALQRKIEKLSLSVS